MMTTLVLGNGARSTRWKLFEQPGWLGCHSRRSSDREAPQPTILSACGRSERASVLLAIVGGQSGCAPGRSACHAPSSRQDVSMLCAVTDRDTPACMQQAAHEVVCATRVSHAHAGVGAGALRRERRMGPELRWRGRRSRTGRPRVCRGEREDADRPRQARGQLQQEEEQAKKLGLDVRRRRGWRTIKTVRATPATLNAQPAGRFR